MARLTATEDEARMPRNRDRLSDEQLDLIAKWIDGGAVFDGDDQDAPIGASGQPKKPDVEVTMADGSESVSFTKDVAPIIVTFCLNCHRPLRSSQLKSHNVTRSRPAPGCCCI